MRQENLNATLCDFKLLVHLEQCIFHDHFIVRKDNLKQFDNPLVNTPKVNYHSTGHCHILHISVWVQVVTTIYYSNLLYMNTMSLKLGTNGYK